MVIMVRNKSVFVVLLFSLFLSFGLLCSAKDFPGRRSEDDPRQRYEDCQRRCQSETRGQTEQDKCEDRCERQFKEEQQRDGDDPQRRYQDCRQHCQQEERRLRPQCEQSCQEQYERQQQQQPDKRFKECQHRCQRQEQGPERKQQCVKECREQYQEDPGKGERENKWREEEEEESDEGEQQQRNNPYYFHRRSFQERFREEHGNFRVLQRFADKHHLLRGINEFRIAILEANPNTFVLPHHCDAEKIYVVTNGRGTITFVTHENKESYNVAPGVVVRIPAGSTVYLANQDNREKLTIAVLHRPVNNPGQFQKFFPAGQENPQSYLRIFSREILEAVFNTRSEQLDELFGGRQSHRRQQGQGMFRKASQEQIRALSQEATSPRGKGSEGYAFNLLSQTPRYSNQNGRFYEACPRNFQQQLQEVDSSVVAFEINKGSIFVPHYNSKATFVVLVTDGNGHVEMVCPHLSRQSSHWSSREEEEQEEQEEQEDERRSGQYKRVRAQLSTGDIFVVPAGHPVTFVASQNKNLGLLGFGLYNGQDNKRIFVAGKTNNVRQWDRQAKELAFGVESRLVDEVFNNNPQESYFVSGQSRRGFDERRGSNNPLSSFLDFARLF
ncbi:vicilin GC72-A [Gossypium arboreum]|nr:vicilin GC72-A [Gossypium arboreum]